MKNSISSRVRLLLRSIPLLSVFVAAMVSSAVSAKCGNVDTIIVNCSNSDNGVWGLIIVAINILTAGIGVVAVGGIIYASVLYASAEDKSEQVNQAKDLITNVVIGIIAYALMFSLLQFLIPGGIFNRDFGSIPKADANPGKSKIAASGSFGGGSSSSGGGSGTSSSTNGIKKIKNLRDAAALTGTLESGVLYRSGQLHGLNTTNSDKLAKLLGSGATIIDLRTPDQRASAKDQPVNGAKNVHIPIDGILDQAPMVTDPARRSQLAKALRLAANSKGSILIHCSSGKDRTGWMVAMIMYISGANDTQVMNEYMKSAEAFPGGVKKEWLNSGLSTARKNYGSIPNYLKKGVGLSNAEISKLRKKFGA